MGKITRQSAQPHLPGPAVEKEEVLVTKTRLLVALCCKPQGKKHRYGTRVSVSLSPLMRIFPGNARSTGVTMNKS